MTERLRIALTCVSMLAIFASSAPSGADPLHKVGSDGDHRHEGSGWIYPKQVAGFVRTDAPYTIDGNNDVGAQYGEDAGNGRRTAVVEVYYPDSAADGATLDAAKQLAKRAAGDDAGVLILAEDPFAIPRVPDLGGVRTRYGSDALQTSLYFFRTTAWIVTVRTSAPASDADAVTALDHFVRALRWDTLGTDPGDLHTSVR